MELNKLDLVIARTRAQIINALKGAPINEQRMADIVNYIRQCPAAFPEWHNSSPAELFTPPTFENKKNASGYFF